MEKKDRGLWLVAGAMALGSVMSLAGCLRTIPRHPVRPPEAVR